MVIYKIERVNYKRKKTCYYHNGYQGKHETGKVLTHFGLFQGLNTLNKLSNKYNCPENFPGCTWRHMSQGWAKMPTWRTSLDIAAVPPRQKEDRALQGRMFAPGPPTLLSNNLCFPKAGSIRLCHYTTNEVSLHLSEKEKSGSSYRVTWETVILGFSCFPHKSFAKKLEKKMFTLCSLSIFYAVKS